MAAVSWPEEHHAMQVGLTPQRLRSGAPTVLIWPSTRSHFWTRSCDAFDVDGSLRPPAIECHWVPHAARSIAS